jgi:NAD(P)-dependent dehydrogenase (short-subunit alcohol dehydrogenase family)
MNLKLTDKTALVSGSTKGIGFAIATHTTDQLLRALLAP